MAKVKITLWALKKERKQTGSKKLSKTEISGIYKVSEGVLINKDNEALSKYRKRKETFRKNNDRVNVLENKINTMSKDMEEIKTILKALVENR